MIVSTHNAIFEFYKNGVVVARGSIQDICKECGCQSRYIYAVLYNPTKSRYLKRVAHIYKIYEVFDAKTGVVEFKGTRDECAAYLYVEPSAISSMVRDTANGKRNGRNGAKLIRLIGEEMREFNRDYSELDVPVKQPRQEKITQMDIDLARDNLQQFYELMPTNAFRLSRSKDVRAYLEEFIDKVEDLCVEEDYDDE